MLSGQTQRILETAAAESVERVRRDRAQAPQRLKPLLAYIEEHLFDPSLDVNQLKRNCGVRDNSVPIQFHSAVGRPPHGYIEDRRLETACRLLGESALKIWQISEVLGYSSIQVFSRAFSRWSGQRPTTYRRKARQRKEIHGAEVAPVVEESLEARTESLRRALAGELSLDDANSLIARLRQLYPEPEPALSIISTTPMSSYSPLPQATNYGAGSSSSFGPTMSSGFNANLGASDHDVDGVDFWDAKMRLEVLLNVEEFEPGVGEQIWKELQKLSWQQQGVLLRDLRLTTPHLFHLLRTKSRLIGRRDPRRGVQVADLALKSLDAVDEMAVGPGRLAALKAQGWAWLANARSQAGDLRGAEQGIGTADRFAQMADRDPLVAGDISLFKAAIRRDQRRFPEAWDLLEAAAEAYRPLDRQDLTATVLIAKAIVRYEEGDPIGAIPFLQEAMVRLDDSADGFLKLSLYHNLVTAYAETGQYSQALELLAPTRHLASIWGKGFYEIRLRWLEGLLMRGRGQFDQAEMAFFDAREQFTRFGDSVAAAMVCIDLAQLYYRQNRLAEVERLAHTMAPLFTALQQHREAFASLSLFQRAIEERNLNNVVLEQARKGLKSSQRRVMAS
jgi:AraC-like DNA-binding protein/tetratricopeptide (TPR) repeat protein